MRWVLAVLLLTVAGTALAQSGAPPSRAPAEQGEWQRVGPPADRGDLAKKRRSETAPPIREACSSDDISAGRCIDRSLPECPGDPRCPTPPRSLPECPGDPRCPEPKDN
jgi:hypothetical protein